MSSKFSYNNLTYSESKYSATTHSPRCSEYYLSTRDKGNLLAFISLLFPIDWYAWRRPQTSLLGRRICILQRLHGSAAN